MFTALIATFLGLVRSRAALQLEILALRHQVGILQQSVKRPKLTPVDRALWVWLLSVWEDWKSGVHIVQASTVVGWHRQGFRMFWTWKIRRGRSGRPKVPGEVRVLIRTMSRENPLWGAPKIHGELLKLGIDIGETSVSKYMVRRRWPPSQTWRAFLEKPHEKHGVRRLLHGTDGPVPDSVRVSGTSTRSAAHHSFRGHGTSNCGVDGPTDA